MSTAKSWKPEVKVNGAWSSNALRFATKEEAEGSAWSLFQRWFLCEDSRAAESEDPVNYKREGDRDIRLEGAQV